MTQRVYGHDKTIHSTKLLNVEVDPKGQIVAVWFRCQPLPFDVSLCGIDRGRSMTRMYEAMRAFTLEAVTIGDPRDEAETPEVKDLKARLLNTERERDYFKHRAERHSVTFAMAAGEDEIARVLGDFEKSIDSPEGTCDSPDSK